MEHFSNYVSLWTAAMDDGFIPDCVCRCGPSPSENWLVTVTSPNKAISRTPFVDPSVNLPNFVVSTGPGLLPAAPANGPQIPLALVPTNGPQIPLVPSPAPAAPAVHVQPSAALQAFLLSGGSVASLPTSVNPGISSMFQNIPAQYPLPVPPSVQILPPLALSASPLVAPSGQPIYDLEKFVTGYVTPSTSLVLQANGMFTAPKSAGGINSPTTWMAAAHAFGNAMSALPDPHQFSWLDFVVFIDTISILFKHYAFEAVFTYEAEFRHWCCAYGHS